MGISLADDGDSTRIKGGTDSTHIGNVGDALKVSAGSSGQKELTKAGQIFSFSTAQNAASGSTDNPILLVRNPGGSGKNIFLIDVFCGTLVANVTSAFKIFANPTITSVGTSQTPANRSIQTSPAATAMNIYTLPTLSALGTELTSFVNGQNSNSVSIITGFQTMVAPGKDIVITAAPSSNNREIRLAAVWSEESI